MDRWDTLWIDGGVATLVAGGPAWGAISDGALGVKDGRVAWVGARADLPGAPAAMADDVREMGGGWMTPGLVDCHTHLVFGGDRAEEWERRIEGATYEAIARGGGGIRATVDRTREAGEDGLLGASRPRLEALLAEGVTTVEIKSGYGLDTETELSMLRVARRLGRILPVDVRTTLLGAHVPPAGDGDGRARYLERVREEMIPRAAGERLADQVDAFCESIAFTPGECEAVLRAGQAHGLAARLHADQLTDCGGAALAARVGARSADHLERASEEGVRAMSVAGTAAVLLPGAFYTLGETQAPPVESLRRHGVDMAVATDLNPGTSPLLSLLLALNMASTLFRLTPEEAVAGATRVAARVLGLEEDRGTLEPGKRADLAVWAVAHPRELCYWIGGNPLVESVKDGVPRPRGGTR
ncbi:MAG: imidazolonepropionase [Gemmatimonadetes bacterium]|nr:imidazolonepropionase [Gemmatimonadota bacterium]